MTALHWSSIEALTHILRSVCRRAHLRASIPFSCGTRELGIPAPFQVPDTIIQRPSGFIWKILSRQNKGALDHDLYSANLKLPKSNRPRSSILRPILFCTLGSAAAFTIAAFKEETNFRKEWEKFKSSSPWKRMSRPSEPPWVTKLPSALQKFYREVWMPLNPAQQVVSGLVAINAAVFLAMKVLPFQGFMIRNFFHHLPPLPSRSITLLTSNFTHSSLWHIAFNMLALWSFGRDAARILGAEQFLGFYVSAGLATALVSHLGRIRSTLGGYSVGASGAVYACFALVAMTKPDTEVVFVFLPWIPLVIGDVLNVMIAFDIVGALLGWKRFDHYGHLGGALFGLYYALRGQQEIWPTFQKLAERMNHSINDKF